MSRPRPFRVTVYLEEAFKTKIDRMWNALTALDMCVDEIHEKAGTITGEWEGPEDEKTGKLDLSILENVPGVAGVVAYPNLPKVIPISKKGNDFSSNKANGHVPRQRRLSEN